MKDDAFKDGILIGYCGICCSICNSYKTKKCPGCPELDCKISVCARSKNHYCFSCKKFPCKLHRKGFEVDMDKIEEFKDLKLGKVRWKPYSKISIKVSKLLKKKHNNEK